MSDTKTLDRAGLIFLNCATCKVDAEAADTHLHDDEPECGTCRMKRHRREALAYAETVAREDAAADTRLLVATPTYSEGCLLRRQAS